jgi:DAK2 domain fusion protein YloV
MSQVKIPVDEITYKNLIKQYTIIDGSTLRNLTSASLSWLQTHQQLINSLNVFPVPDGDTGTNMLLTMQSAWDEIANMDDRSIGQLSKAIAHGALMGARGNSGVILSQIWRGMARALDDLPTMNASDFAKGLREARETAYKGVVHPVEGTILTVSTDIAEAADNAIQDGTTSVLEVLEKIVDAADISVKRTPDLLPVLKEAGVVDSGGKGLFIIFEGMLRAIYGLPLDESQAAIQPLSDIALDHSLESIEPGQDWEVIVDFVPSSPLDIENFYHRLEQMGTSIQVGQGDSIYRMHIHVPDKSEYKPIEYTKQLGTVTKIAIENLMEQTKNLAEESSAKNLRLATVEPNQIALVSVAPGHGIAHVFASLGAAAIIEGGQTMNPSTQEILSSFENLPTDNIIILPNNKNILMAAKQSAELTVKNVAVIPTVTIPQGIAAMLAMEPNADLDKLVANMTVAMKEITTGEITIATRSVEIDGVKVHQNQVIGMLDGKLVVAGDQIDQVLLDILNKANASEAELITLYYGAGLSSQQANRLADGIRAQWPAHEIEVIEGGQPHYHLIISVE